VCVCVCVCAKEREYIFHKEFLRHPFSGKTFRQVDTNGHLCFFFN